MSRTPQVVAWLVLGTVAFWWGLVVVWRLIDYAAVSTGARAAQPFVQHHLNADLEGNLANSVSGAVFLVTALLAGRAAVVERRRLAPGFVVGGWVAVGLIAAILGLEDLVNARRMFEQLQVIDRLGQQWLLVLLCVVVVAVGLATAVFLTRDTHVRRPWLVGLGFVCWLLVVLHEYVLWPFIAAGRGLVLGLLTEETLEVSGSLLIGMGATVAMHQRPIQARWRAAALAGASTAGVIVVGTCVLALVFRPPLADVSEPSRINVFNMSLRNEGSVIQRFGRLPAPLASIDVHVSNDDPNHGAGSAIWRMVAVETSDRERLVREGRMALPAGRQLKWRTIRFPPIAEATERPVALQLVAEVAPGAHLRIAATKTARYPDGRLWINGDPAWSDQNLEFVAYGAREPTWSKLRAIGHLLTSGWQWPLLLASLAVSFTLITFVPALLAAYAWPVLRRSSP